MAIHTNSISIPHSLLIWVHRTRGTFRVLVRDSISCINRNHIKATRIIRIVRIQPYSIILILQSIHKSSDQSQLSMYALFCTDSALTMLWSQSAAIGRAFVEKTIFTLRKHTVATRITFFWMNATWFISLAKYTSCYRCKSYKFIFVLIFWLLLISFNFRSLLTFIFKRLFLPLSLIWFL